MSSEQANLFEQGIEALKKVFSTSNSSTDENTANQNRTTYNTASTRKMTKDSETKDEHKLAEPRYNGQLIAGMRVAELKSALDKLGVGSKRTDKKADLEIALKAAIEDHHHMLSPGGTRSKSIPTPLSGSKAGGAVRSLSSPPGAGRSLRSAGYGLRSRDNSSGRGTTSRSKAAETSAGHIKASVATSNKGSYEENDMLYYSVKSGASKAMAQSRSPSVASKRSRTRSVRSARSSRTNTHVSEGEEDSIMESSDGEENAPPTVVKKRVPVPPPLKPREPTPKKREPTPSKKEPTPNKREPTPSKRDPTPKKREPTPQKKTATPNKKQRVEPKPSAEDESQLESASAESESDGDGDEEAQHAALNDSNNFFDAADGGADYEAAEMYEELLESPEQQLNGDGDEGSGSDEGEGSDAVVDSDGDIEMVEEVVADGEGQLLEPDEEYSDNSDEEEEDAEGEDDQFEDQYEDEDGEGDEHVEYSDEEDSQDGIDEEESSNSEGESYNFGDYIKPRKGDVKQGEVIDLMDSDEDEAQSEEEYVPPAFPNFTFTATPAVANAATTPFTFGTAPKPEAASEFSFTAPKVVPGTTFTASAAAALPVYNFSIGSSGTKAAPAKVLPTVGFNGLPYTAPAPVTAPAVALNFAAYSFDKAPAPAFTFPAPVQTAPAAAPKPAAPITQPSAELSPAAVAFSKLSQNCMSVFASNLTSSDKKETLTAEEYSLLKTLLERSKPANLADDDAKSKMDVMPSPAEKVSGSANGSAKKVTIATLDTQQSSGEKKAQPADEVHHHLENKENKTTKSISFDPRSTAIPRTSFDGAGWNSRESFLPSPPETPGSMQLPQVGDSSVSGQLFAENASVRLAHRMPTPYHAAKRTAFHAGWTGGSEVTTGAEEEDFLTMPPSKRQSLGGYRSIQYRQATPGAAYVNANRLSVGSGMLSDTPDSTWSAGSNLRTSTVRSSISGYPSALPQPAYGSHLGGAAYTPMFRNNAARFTPLTGPQYPASAVAANSVQAPAMSSESRVSRLPVAARSSNGSITNSASKALPATLSYIQRRKLQMQSDSGASAAVAKKILDTLGGLSTPMEEQRQKPTAITWHSDTDKVTQVVAAAPVVAASRDAHKTAHSVSFAAGSPFLPATFAAQMEAPKSMAEATGAQAKSPFLHSSVRKQLDDGKETDKAPPSFGFAIPPKATTTTASSVAANTPAEEFPFTAPTEVSGMEEYVDSTAGGSSSVKFIFSPPNTRKSAPAVAATSDATAAKPAVAAAKTTADSAAASSGTNIWAASMINDGVKCGVCLAKNKKDATKCAACENPIGASAVTPKAASTAPVPQTAAVIAPAAGGNNIWAASSINDGVKCKTCLSKNKAGATKCAACECPIGDAAPSSGSSSTAAAPKAPGAIGTGGFTFGAPAASTAPAAPAAAEVSKGFTFGTAAPAVSSAPPAVTAKVTEGFTFGGAPAAVAPVTAVGTGFTFGAPSESKAPSAAAEKPAATSSGFSVPVAAADSKPSESKPAAFGGFTFGAPAAPATVPVLPAVAKVESTPVSSLPAFGAFGKPKEAETSVPETAPASTASSFTFGGAAATSTPAPAPAASNPFASSQAPYASFGGFGAKRPADSDASKDKQESDEQPARKRTMDPATGSYGGNSMPAFGAFPALPTVDASKAAAAAPFTGFGGFTSSAKPASDTASASILPAFGGFAPKPVEEKKTEAPAAAADAKPFTFGSAAAPTTTPALVPSATSAASFAFGASTAAASKPVDQPFMFGASTAAKPAETEAPKAPFTFGGAAAKEIPALPAFGSVATAPAGITPGFSFDSKPAVTTATSLPAFGLPSAAPAPAATPSSSFVFGASNAATTAGKPPLASNSLGGSTLTFPQAGVAAVDSRTTAPNGNGNGTVSPHPAIGANNNAMTMDSPGSTMDTGSFSNQAAPAPAISGNPFSSSFSSSSSSNLAANPFGGAASGSMSGPFGAPASSFAFPAAPVPSSSLGSALGGNTSTGGFTFGSNNNLASAAPAFGGGAFAPAAANLFGAPAASSNPFGAPAAANNPFGAPAAAGNPFSSQSVGAFGAAPATGLPPVGSSSNLFGGAPVGGAPFGNTGGIGSFGGGGAFGSTGSLQSLGSTVNTNNMGGMGGFGLQSQTSVDSGAGGFSLGATGKSTADTAVRRKVKVKGRP